MFGGNDKHGQAASRVGASPRVLVVSETLRDLAHNRAILQTLGCEVLTCASYVEGLRSLETLPWDMVLVDQGSPAFEGQCVLERALEISRDTPVIVLTGWHNIPAYIHAMHLGAVDYLEKPVSLSEMSWILGTHLRFPRSKGANPLSVGRDVEAYAKESCA